MRVAVSEYLKEIISSTPEGDTVHKFLPAPQIKPPRREPAIRNKTQKSDYMKEYMTDYRGDGKDYQKVPEKVKEWRKKRKEDSKK